MNEADTCRKFVVPLLQAGGWDNDPHSINEQRYFTKGRIVVRGIDANRGPRNADSFRAADLHPDLKADFAPVRKDLANPPFNMSDWGGENLRQDVLQVGRFPITATSMKSSVNSAVKANFNRCSKRRKKL